MVKNYGQGFRRIDDKIRAQIVHDMRVMVDGGMTKTAAGKLAAERYDVSHPTAMNFYHANLDSVTPASADQHLNSAADGELPYPSFSAPETHHPRVPPVAAAMSPKSSSDPEDAADVGEEAAAPTGEIALHGGSEAELVDAVAGSETLTRRIDELSTRFVAEMQGAVLDEMIRMMQQARDDLHREPVANA